MNAEEKNRELASCCHDIFVSLAGKEVPEYEFIQKIGMAVRLALHLRGLPIVKYSVLRLVASYYLQIPSVALENILEILEEVEFIKIDSEGKTIKSILPKVPFFDDLYLGIGEYSKTYDSFSEEEELAVAILKKLSQSPLSKSSVYEIGAEKKSVERSLQIGSEGGYVLQHRARGKDILYSPIFFSENADLYADLVSKNGASNVKRILSLIKKTQGWPLPLIESNKEINGVMLSEDDVNLIRRLARDGAIKPPSISTSHAGESYFLFTPSPNEIKLNPSKKEIYERAMALVSAMRQGQLLPKEYAIRSPKAVLNALKRDGSLRANTEALEQYKTLTVLRVGRLEQTSGQWYRFHLNDIEESHQAVEMALDLLEHGEAQGTEVDDEARIALQKDQIYIESLISSQKLRERKTVKLSEEHKMEMDDLFLGGVSDY